MKNKEFTPEEKRQKNKQIRAYAFMAAITIIALAIVMVAVIVTDREITEMSCIVTDKSTDVIQGWGTPSNAYYTIVSCDNGNAYKLYMDNEMWSKYAVDDALKLQETIEHRLMNIQNTSYAVDGIKLSVNYNRLCIRLN